jgi:hypothetical protein
MDSPWWFGLAFVGIVGIMVVRRGRFFLALWRKVKSGRARMDDDWDPFE